MTARSRQPSTLTGPTDNERGLTQFLYEGEVILWSLNTGSAVYGISNRRLLLWGTGLPGDPDLTALSPEEIAPQLVLANDEPGGTIKVHRRRDGDGNLVYSEMQVGNPVWVLELLNRLALGWPLTHVPLPETRPRKRQIARHSVATEREFQPYLLPGEKLLWTDQHVGKGPRVPNRPALGLLAAGGLTCGVLLWSPWPLAAALLGVGLWWLRAPREPLWLGYAVANHRALILEQTKHTRLQCVPSTALRTDIWDPSPGAADVFLLDVSAGGGPLDPDGACFVAVSRPREVLRLLGETTSEPTEEAGSEIAPPLKHWWTEYDQALVLPASAEAYRTAAARRTSGPIQPARSHHPWGALQALLEPDEELRWAAQPTAEAISERNLTDVGVAVVFTLLGIPMLFGGIFGLLLTTCCWVAAGFHLTQWGKVQGRAKEAAFAVTNKRVLIDEPFLNTVSVGPGELDATAVIRSDKTGDIVLTRRWTPWPYRQLFRGKCLPRVQDPERVVQLIQEIQNESRRLATGVDDTRVDPRLPNPDSPPPPVPE